MRVRDVMSSPAVSLRPRTQAGRAAALLVERGFTAAPVLDAEGRLRGIATEADLLRGRLAADGGPAPVVADLMTPCPATVAPDAALADLAAQMLATGVRSVPVLEDGRLVGVVTRRDVLRAVAAPAATAAGAGDRP